MIGQWWHSILISFQTGPMLLVYAYHRLDYPSPYKTKHEKQGFKIVTLIPADTGKTQTRPRCEITENSLAAQNTQMLSTPIPAKMAASSVMNDTVIVPVAKILRSASLNAAVSFTFLFSFCSLILTAILVLLCIVSICYGYFFIHCKTGGERLRYIESRC